MQVNKHLNMLLRVDNLVESHHTGMVTSATIIRLNVLNHSWACVSPLLFLEQHHQPEPEHHQQPQQLEQQKLEQFKSDSNDVSLASRFQAFEQEKEDYMIQFQVADDYEYLDFLEIEEENDFVEGSVHKYEDNVVYVSPSAFFNIIKRMPQLYLTYRGQGIGVRLKFFEEFHAHDTSNQASFVEIAQVACPFQLPADDSVDVMLQNYFKKPKVLGVEEVFNIPVGERGFNKPYSVWFSVRECRGLVEEVGRTRLAHTKSLFVSSRTSKLVLSKATNENVPQCPCTVNNNPKLINLFENPNYRDAYREHEKQLLSAIDILRYKFMPPKDVAILIDGPAGVGKGLLVKSVCQQCCMHFHEENCYDLIGDSMSATEKRIEKLFETISGVGPCVLYLKRIELLGKDKEGLHEERRVIQCLSSTISNIKTNYPLLIVGSTDRVKEVSVRLRSQFIHHITIEAPNDRERLSLVRAIGANCFAADENVMAEMVRKTSGFVFSDIVALITKACNKKNTKHTRSVSLDTGQLISIDSDSIDSAFEEIRIMKSGNHGVHIPKVRWEDVGGLQHVKKDIMETIQLPLKFPTLFSSSIRRSGLLFYGPPGCGKTLLAKAIATEFSLNFYNVKGPELINMYVGQSEENVRNVFEKARRMAPCVIFFDELDSVAPNRGSSGDSGGVMDRVVSQLLTELDGMHSNTDIFIVGATNRPDLLDPALLRPGRFDKIVYVGVPEDREERLRILKAVTRKLRFADDVDLDELINQCPQNLTGADFSALASECLMNCYRRLIHQHEQNGTELNVDSVIVTRGDIELAFCNLKPSVSAHELERYKAIRDQFMEER